ncbi:MAG TPA: hypothetical protein VJI15_03850 [Candidatus Nanoarchaeia archaeon]|nr:hypothetical protein [Candidatus Nanoarchaeia archaeon]
MASEIRDIGELVYLQYNFAHSEREPTSADQLVIYTGVYYYRWRGSSIEEGIDLLTQPDSQVAATAKLFRVSWQRLSARVDLHRERPMATGHKIIDFLNAEYERL